MTEHLTVGTASSPAWASSHLRLGQLRRPLEPTTRCQVHGENDGARTEYRMQIQHRVERSDREQRSLSLEGPEPKAFGSNVRDTCFPKRFWVPNNIVKDDGETTPSV
jgi:hypothetical protein